MEHDTPEQPWGDAVVAFVSACGLSVRWTTDLALGGTAAVFGSGLAGALLLAGGAAALAHGVRRGSWPARVAGLAPPAGLAAVALAAVGRPAAAIAAFDAGVPAAVLPVAYVQAGRHDLSSRVRRATAVALPGATRGDGGRSG